MSSTYSMPVALPQDTFTFSQSSLQDYADCPRRFGLRYLQGVLWPAAESEPILQTENRQRQGVLFHRLVHQRFLGIPDAALAPAAADPDLSTWWKNFVGAGPALDGWTLYPEKALTCQLGAHRLTCKYDLIAVRESKVVIYDWKTFGRRPKDEWLAARMQTKAYRATIVQAGEELNDGRPFEPADISMMYWFAEFPESPASFGYDRQQHERDWSSLLHLVEQIAADAEFELTSDLAQCKFCTFRSLCDRGTRAGVDAAYESPTTSGASADDTGEQIGEIQL